MDYEGTEVAIMQKSKLFHGEKITATETSRKHYYLTYKNHELDIGDHELTEGLLTALNWFGNIIKNETKR
jgi:hypothetical protein